MKQFDRQFQSMKKKMNLSEQEKYEILAQVNEKMIRRPSKTTTISWKYIGSLVTAFTLIFIISLSVFIQEMYKPAGNLHEETSVLIDDVDETESIVEVITEFLPPNSSLVSPENPKNIDAIQFYDFDKDGEAEVIATYERKSDIEPSPSQYGVIVLQKASEGWQKIWEKQTEGVGFVYSELVDVTTDGVKEFLFGVTIGASVGHQLEIFKWENKKLQPIFDIYYHQFEIVKNVRTGLAFWDRFVADTYLVNVLSWNGEEFVFDEELFAKYYPTIEAFYEEKIAYMDAWFYWYALADAQIKANLLEDAKNSIQKGIDLAEEMELTDAVESLQKLKEELEKKEKAS